MHGLGCIDWQLKDFPSKFEDLDAGSAARLYSFLLPSFPTLQHPLPQESRDRVDQYALGLGETVKWKAWMNMAWSSGPDQETIRTLDDPKAGWSQDWRSSPWKTLPFAFVLFNWIMVTGFRCADSQFLDMMDSIDKVRDRKKTLELKAETAIFVTLCEKLNAKYNFPYMVGTYRLPEYQRIGVMLLGQAHEPGWQGSVATPSPHRWDNFVWKQTNLNQDAREDVRKEVKQRADKLFQPHAQQALDEVVGVFMAPSLVAVIKTYIP